MASEHGFETPHLRDTQSGVLLQGQRPEATQSSSDIQRISGHGTPGSGHSRPQRFISFGKGSIFLPIASCRGGPSPTAAARVDRTSGITGTARPNSSPALLRPRSRQRPSPLRLAIPLSSSEESIVVLPPVPVPSSGGASGAPTSSQPSGTNVPNFSRQSFFHISKSSRQCPPQNQLDVLNPVNTTPRSFTLSTSSDRLLARATPFASLTAGSSPAIETQRKPDPRTHSQVAEEKRRSRYFGYNPFNLPAIPSPSLGDFSAMATSPQTQTGHGPDFPTSPTNYTPKDLRGSKPPSTSSSAHRPRDPNTDSENQPQIPPSPSDHSLPWTPAHPCYPHPNPHVPRQDIRASTTRVIRVHRDWSNAGDLYPQFSDTYPEILAPWITEREFRSLIATVNDASRVAFDPTTGRAWFDTVMGLATGWLWEDIGLAAGSAGAQKCERVISTWNAECSRRRAADRGTPAVAVEKDIRHTGVDLVECVPLRRTAWMSLDFVIPDPKISVVPDKPGAQQPTPANNPRITPRGSGERLGERDRREASRKSSRKPSAEKFTQVGPSGTGAGMEKTTGGAGDGTRDLEKGREVGMAM